MFFLSFYFSFDSFKNHLPCLVIGEGGGVISYITSTFFPTDETVLVVCYFHTKLYDEQLNCSTSSNRLSKESKYHVQRDESSAFPSYTFD